MAIAQQNPTKPASKLGVWTPWLIVALVAVLAGLMLPPLMTGEPVIDSSRAKVETKSKSTSEYTAPAMPDMPSPQAMLARLFVGTVFVLGLSVVSLWGVRRWLQTNAPANSTPRELRLIETLQLGNRCSVHLVHLGKREILIIPMGPASRRLCRWLTPSKMFSPTPSRCPCLTPCPFVPARHKGEPLCRPT